MLTDFDNRTAIMLLALILLDLFITRVVDGRLNSFLITMLYGVVGGGVYLLITYKTIVTKAFDQETINRILGKFKRKKRSN